jgi:type IV pilus assembly protein PilM
MAKSPLRVGLDLEQSSIAAVETKVGKQHQVLSRAYVRGLPEGLMFEGEVVDPDGLAAQLKAFWKEGGFSGKRVDLGIANQKIVVRTMDFPVIDEKELRAAIEFHAQEHIPIPVEEAILDYQVLWTYTDADGSAKQRILLVAAQREMIRQFLDVARKAGLSVSGIDLQAFAIIRALAPRASFIDQGAPAEGSPGADVVALVNMGSGITNLAITAGGIPQFTRVINLGSESLNQALSANRGISRDEAEVFRVMVGLQGEQPDEPGDITPETMAEVHQVLEMACEAFSDELRRSIDYYHTQEHSGEITKLVLTGDGSLTRNIVYYLAQSLHLPVEVGNPLREVGENKSKLSEAELEALAPRLAIAIGLALEDEV